MRTVNGSCWRTACRENRPRRVLTLWRKLRRFGAVQVLDGLAGLPLTPRTREQFEWLADEVIEADGEASVWMAAPLSAAEERDLTSRLTRAIVDEYSAITTAAQSRSSRTVAGAPPNARPTAA